MKQSDGPSLPRCLLLHLQHHGGCKSNNPHGSAQDSLRRLVRFHHQATAASSAMGHPVPRCRSICHLSKCLRIMVNIVHEVRC